MPTTPSFTSSTPPRTNYKVRDLYLLHNRQIRREDKQDVKHLQRSLHFALLCLGLGSVGAGSEPGKRGVKVPQHTPIRVCQLTFPRYTCPYTNHPALDTRKDVEPYREPVLRLSSQIPQVLLAVSPFALVLLSLALDLWSGLDVPQRA